MSNTTLKYEPKIKSNQLTMLFVLISLFLFSGSFSTYFEKFTFTSLIILFVHLVIILTSVVNIQPIFWNFKKIKVLFLLLIIIVLSIIWSENPNTSFYKVVQLISTTLLAIQVTLRYKLNDFLKRFELFLWAIVFLSIFYIVFFPSIGIENGYHQGSWKGIFGQKNTFGIILMFLLTIRVSKIISNKRKLNMLNFLLIPLLIFFIVKTGSSTALVISVLIFFVAIFVILFKVLSRIVIASVIAISFSIVGALYLVIEALNLKGNLLNILGRDSTLTGRTAIWDTIQNVFIAEKPLLGYGFGLFWSSNSPYVYQFQEIIKFKTITSHNGYLDLVLDIGLLGAALVIILFISSIIKTFSLFYKYKYNFNVLWIGLFMISLIIYNFSESMILKENSLYWFLIVLIINYLGRNEIDDKA